ncbi:MAG: zf-HC2 domain-containing protein [Planctomycetes bacterium]|nr:zf-HC2 domain-containing protein [Planctomycetota bacterium]
MYCEERDNLAAFLDGELEPGEAERLRRHIEGCAECREYLALLKRSYDALEYVEPVEVPEGLGTRVLAGARKRSRVPMFAAAAGLVAAALVFTWLSTKPGVGPAPVEDPQVAWAAGLTGEEQGVVENMDILEDYDILSDLDLLAQYDTLAGFEEFPEIEAI